MKERKELRPVIRTTIDWNPEVYEKLRGLADRDGTTIAQKIRNAVKLYLKYDETISGGGQVIHEEADGKKRSILLL